MDFFGVDWGSCFSDQDYDIYGDEAGVFGYDSDQDSIPAHVLDEYQFDDSDQDSIPARVPDENEVYDSDPDSIPGHVLDENEVYDSDPDSIPGHVLDENQVYDSDSDSIPGHVLDENQVYDSDLDENQVYDSDLDSIPGHVLEENQVYDSDQDSIPGHVLEENQVYDSDQENHQEDDSDFYEDDESTIGSETLSSSDDEEVEETEKWIQHYSSSQRILLVGEGNYSFSVSLAKAFRSARNIVATSLDSFRDLGKKYSDAVANVRELEEMGGLVLSGLDATQMKEHHFLTTQRFDRIVYNFPHVGFRFPEANGCQIKMNKDLVKGFLRNAKALLKKDIGEIHITHKNGYPYDKWNLVKKAQKIGLVLHESKPFYQNKYPGYLNKRAHGRFSNEPFTLGDCTTYKFRLPQKSP